MIPSVRRRSSTPRKHAASSAMSALSPPGIRVKPRPNPLQGDGLELAEWLRIARVAARMTSALVRALSFFTIAR